MYFDHTDSPLLPVTPPPQVHPSQLYILWEAFNNPQNPIRVVQITQENGTIHWNVHILLAEGLTKRQSFEPQHLPS